MNFNSRKIECKSPYGAVKCGEKLSLHFPIASWVSVDKMYVFIRLGGVSTPVEMRFEKSENGFSVYTADYVFDTAGIYYYRSEMRNRDGVWYYGRGENGESVCGENLPEWQLTVYKSTYKTPDFAKGNIIYHVFVDRFNRAVRRAAGPGCSERCWSLWRWRTSYLRRTEENGDMGLCIWPGRCAGMFPV